jgi:hypothetical protein
MENYRIASASKKTVAMSTKAAQQKNLNTQESEKRRQALMQ